MFSAYIYIYIYIYIYVCVCIMYIQTYTHARTHTEQCSWNQNSATHFNLIGHSLIATPPELSPSSILLSTSFGSVCVWRGCCVVVAVSLSLSLSAWHIVSVLGVFPAVTGKPEWLPAKGIKEGRTVKAGSRLDARINWLTEEGCSGTGEKPKLMCSWGSG